MGDLGLRTTSDKVFEAGGISPRTKMKAFLRDKETKLEEGFRNAVRSILEGNSRLKGDNSEDEDDSDCTFKTDNASIDDNDKNKKSYLPQTDVDSGLAEVWTKFFTRHGLSPPPFTLNNNSNLHPSTTSTEEATRSLAGGYQPSRKFKTTTSSKLKSMSAFHFSRHYLSRKFALIYIRQPFEVLLWSLRIGLLLMKLAVAIVIAVLTFYCLFTLHKPTQAIISRHSQDYIYPFMRFLRLLSIPVVKNFPVLTDHYEASCLISNPFYDLQELNCWPCEGVRHVIDLTGFSNFSSEYHHSGIPFTVKDSRVPTVGLKEFEDIVNEQHVLKNSFVRTNIYGLISMEQLLRVGQERPVCSACTDGSFHMQWHINRISIARLWRNYFMKPYFVPDHTEISVENYIFMDGPLSNSYKLPTTEFANVFLIQSSGSRTIVLIPTSSCQETCKVVSVVLKPNEILFYNWLFWRPMSIPAKTHSREDLGISIAVLGSFY